MPPHRARSRPQSQGHKDLIHPSTMSAAGLLSLAGGACPRRLRGGGWEVSPTLTRERVTGRFEHDGGRGRCPLRPRPEKSALCSFCPIKSITVPHAELSFKLTN